MSQIDVSTGATSVSPELVGEFPCTQTQLRWWFLDRLTPGNPALNVAVRWEIRGSFKASTIEAAFRKVIQRHEILRTRFVEKEGQPFQQVVDAVDFKMPVIDLRTVPSAQREKLIMSIGEETASAPFDLRQAGLMRVTLLIVENDRGFILITAHHSCFDGWSIRVLGREVGEIAAAIDAGRQPVLPELPLQYGDFSLWQDEYLTSCGFEDEKTYWRDQLGDAPYFEVTTDHPRQAIKTDNGSILSVAKPVEFGERIEQAAREHKVSLYSYGAAVVSAMLHRYTGARDILLGTQIAGRDQPELEDLIGVFINSLILRFRVSGDPSFGAHVQAAGEVVAGALDHQGMPYNKLVEMLNPVRDASRAPLVSVNFNLQKAFLEDRRYGDFELISAPSQSPGVIYDLSFIMIGRPSGWRMSIEYNTDLFDKETIEALLQLWEEAYELVLDSPQARLSSFPVRERDGAAVANAPVRPGAAHWQSPVGGTAPQGAVEALLPDRDGQSVTAKSAAVAAIWADVLDRKNIAPQDDFFGLGGHSLLAVRMLSAVRERFGVTADLGLLFKAPTLKGFCSELFGDVTEGVAACPARAPWELSVYKTGTGARSVYTLNHPFLYYRLAQELPDSISVYNVNMLNAVQDRTDVGSTIEEIAAGAVKAMRVEQRPGPVAIVGLCANGVLAMEVSRQLREAGVEVTFTAIIDSWAPGFFRSLSPFQKRWWTAERRIKRIGYFTGKLLSGGISPMVYLKEFNLTLSLMRKLGINAAEPTAEEAANAESIELLMRAARTYRLGKAGDTMLFRSQAYHRRANRLVFGWGPAVGEDVKVIDLDGWHEYSLTIGGIRKLARCLQERLGAESA